MAFRWRADDGPFIAVFGSSIPSSTKKKNKNKKQKKKRYQIWTPSDKLTFWICAWIRPMDKKIITIYSRYICNFCHYGTENYKTIRNHMYSHEPVKYQCPYCGFKRAPRWVNHRIQRRAGDSDPPEKSQK